MTPNRDTAVRAAASLLELTPDAAARTIEQIIREAARYAVRRGATVETAVELAGTFGAEIATALHRLWSLSPTSTKH